MNIEELFRAQNFAKFGLRASYHQILLKEEDQYKTTFRIHHGHLRMACYAIWVDECSS